METSAQTVYRNMLDGDVTIVHVDFDKDYYKIRYIAGDTTTDLPIAGKYSESISGFLPLFWQMNAAKSVDVERMKRMLSADYARAAYRMGRYDYMEYFDVCYGSHDDIILKVRVQLNRNSTEACTATIIYGVRYKESKEHSEDEFSKVWENIDNYSFAHEIDLNTWQVTLLKYPEDIFPKVRSIVADYEECKDQYIKKFTSLSADDEQVKAFSKERIMQELEKNKVYSVDFRFERKSGKTEWYEINYTRSTCYPDRVLLTVKNIEYVVHTKMQSEVQKAAYDESYIATLYCNFTRNTLSVLSGREKFRGESAITFDGLIQLIANHLDTDTKNRYLQLMNRQRLMEQLKEQDDFTVELEDYEYNGEKCDMQVVLKRIYNIKDEVCCALMIRDTRLLAASRREKQLQQNILGVALEKVYSTVLQINLTKDEYSTIYTSAGISASLPTTGKVSYLFSRMQSNTDEEFREEIEDRLSLEAIREKAKDDNLNLIMRYRRIAADGERVWMKLQLVFIDNPINSDRIALAFVTEIENEMRREMEMRNALEEATKANRAKTEFLFNVSHDIRTPMNAIMGYSEMLYERPDDVRFVKETVEKVRTSSTYMLSLLNNILNMSSIETGKMAIERVPKRLKKEVDGIEAMIRPMADRKKITFTFNNYETHDEVVLLDAPKFEQILMNVVGNAIKFTGEGANVFVSFDAEDSDRPGYHKYCFECKDEGIGIPEEFIEHAFEPFTRAKNTVIGQSEGTGLGLAITKKLVDAMGGEIRLTSMVGVGTTVRIYFYFKETDENPREEIKTVVSNLPNLHGIRILAAEDKMVNYEVLRLMLEKFNVVLEHAVNGVEAVKMVEESKDGYYSVILMDIQMPIMNGYDACRAIKNLPREDVKKLPIIAMTANAYVEDVQDAYDSGMVGHIAKPISRTKICDELKKHLEDENG